MNDLTTLIRRSMPTIAMDPLPGSLFNTPFFGGAFENLTASTQNLMDRYKLEDGSTVFEYNLAGFEENEISVSYDTASNDLMIKAERDTENSKRRFATTLTLSAYTGVEDIKTEYRNGVLKVIVAPLEKRRAEAIIPISINGTSMDTKSLEKGRKKKDKTAGTE